jgi:hypothetical protein
MTFWDGHRWVEEAQRRPQPPQRLARLRDTVATLIILVGVLGTATLIAPVDARSPQLWTAPSAATVGTVVTAYGRGFTATTTVQLLWDNQPTGMPAVSVGDRGRFTARFTVPRSSPGAHAVTAAVSTASRRGVSASTTSLSTGSAGAVAATFTVLDPSGATSQGPTDPADPVTPKPTAAPVATQAPPDPTKAPAPDPTKAPAPDPTPKPPADPPANSDIPAMPAGDLLRKSFSDGSLGPFRAITYPNDHPGDAMGYACDYKTGSGVISVHDGYLDVRAKPGTGNRWDCGFLSTGMDGNGHAASFSFKTGYVQFAARLNVGFATWQAPLWLLNTVSGWNSAEIDCAEVIGGKLTFNIHGPANVQVAGRNAPANLDTDWHVFGIAKASDHVTFTMDGNEVGTWHGSMPDPMALLIDSKVGFQWDGIYPNSQTPRPAYAHVAWVTVSSKIPSGL